MAEVDRTEPLEGWLPAPPLADMDFLDQVQAGQHVGDVVQSAHFSCRQEEDVQLGPYLSRGSPLTPPPSLPFGLTFVLAVTGGVLTVLDEDLGCCVQGDGLRLGDQEQHDKLLAHNAQRLVFPVTSG